MLKRTQLTSATYKLLRKLNTPAKIQDFVNSIPFNHEKKMETYRSVEEALKFGSAHCFEGALIAAAALWTNGHTPLLMDIRTTNDDVDHVVALFKKGRYWGAVSKTNHGVLRFREPVYKSVRELAMSFFHEYFLEDGTKTMREYSNPFDLSKTKFNWLSGKENLTLLVDELDRSPHEEVLPRGLRLRKADKVEIAAGKITEYP